MNTSYTINTALSKGVESTTRHHSPLTTEYISFQHIYKSYSEREKETEVHGEDWRKRESQVCLHRLNQRTLIIKKNEWIQGCAMDWFILRDVQRFILMRNVEVKKTTNQDTSLTIWQTRYCRSKRRIGSRTGVFFFVCFFKSGKKSLLLQHSLCALRRIIAELLYVLCSNHYDGSNVLRY